MLLGLSLFAGLNYIGPRVDFAHQKGVSTRMTDTVQRSLWSFVSRNYRLPCPADGTLNSQTSSAGVENCALSTPSAAVVPWRTLGLPLAAVQDGWGNMVGYVATSALTTGTPYKTAVPSSDSVKVTVSGATNLFAYALMSFGPDGGGYNIGGGQVPVSNASNLNATETQFEATNRTALASSGTTTAFVSSTLKSGATGAQWLVFEGSTQVCSDVNGGATGNSQLYCHTPTNVQCATPAACSPLSMNNALTMTSATQTNPNGVSSGAVLMSSGLKTPVLVLGTNSTTPSITAAPTLTGDSQACSWSTIPLQLTSQTLRAYFEFSTVGSTAGDGFTFSILPASTDISAGTPCGGTPGGNTNEGSYLGFEAIADGGLNGSATATPTVQSQTVTSIAVNAKGQGYLWVPPVEITDSNATPGTGATAHVSGMSLHGASVTNLGFGYIDSPGNTVVPDVYVAPAGGLGYQSVPQVWIETAAATGCTLGASCANAKGHAVISGIGGQVTQLVLDTPGAGYTRAPAVTIDTAVNTGCTAGCANAIGASAVIDGTFSGTHPVVGLFISNDTCGSGCTKNTGAVVSSMAITGVSLTSGGSGYLIPPGGAGYTATPNVLIFNNNSNGTNAGQGATATATVASGAVTGITLNNGGNQYSSASVTIAGGGIAYFTIGSITNGGVTSLALADSGAIGGHGTYTETGGSLLVTLPPPVRCSACTPAVVAVSISGQGYALADPIVVSSGSGYDPNYDLGNYVPVTDSGHQTAIANVTVGATNAITSLTLSSATSPQVPTVKVQAASGEPGTIVPATLSAVVSQSGVLTSLVINSVGSGYTKVPTIIIDAPTGCPNGSTCPTASAAILSMSVLAVTPKSTTDSYTAIPSVGIDPPKAGNCSYLCYGASAAANTSITTIHVDTPGSGYNSGSTIATLPPPNVLPKLGIEFRTYHHPTDPYFSDYGYHDDWGFFGSNNVGAFGTNAQITSALTALGSGQTSSATGYMTGTGIMMPKAVNGTQSPSGNIRHDDNTGAGCDGSNCVPEYMSALLVDAIHHDDTYHYSALSTANAAYTVSPSCDATQGTNAPLHDGGFVSGGSGTGGTLAYAYASGSSATTANAAVGGCTYDGTNGTAIVTSNGPISDTENGSGVFYHPVRVEIRRYCDPTCSSCGNQQTPGENYIQVAAYLDCDSAALGAACNDLTQNLLVKGSQVFSITVLNGGSGYITAPAVSIQTVGGDVGSGATATATITGGQVTKVTVTSRGLNYSSPPNISFSGGSGTGATAVASIAGLPLTGYSGNHVYAMNYCTVDPAATTWTSSQQGLSALDNILTGFTAGAGAATRGVLIRNLQVGSY